MTPTEYRNTPMMTSAEYHNTPMMTSAEYRNTPMMTSDNTPMMTPAEIRQVCLDAHDEILRLNEVVRKLNLDLLRHRLALGCARPILQDAANRKTGPSLIRNAAHVVNLIDAAISAELPPPRSSPTLVVNNDPKS